MTDEDKPAWVSKLEAAIEAKFPTEEEVPKWAQTILDKLDGTDATDSKTANDTPEWATKILTALEGSKTSSKTSGKQTPNAPKPHGRQQAPVDAGDGGKKKSGWWAS
jgi:hypothetical protein